jgi:hypothetical protein
MLLCLTRTSWAGMLWICHFSFIDWGSVLELFSVKKLTVACVYDPQLVLFCLSVAWVCYPTLFPGVIRDTVKPDFYITLCVAYLHSGQMKIWSHVLVEMISADTVLSVGECLWKYLLNTILFQNTSPIMYLLLFWVKHECKLTCCICDGKESYPCNRLWRPIRLWDIEASTFSKWLAHWGEVISLTHQLPSFPRKIPGTHFC